jgi:phage gp36-like protein
MPYATPTDLQARYPQTRLAELSDPDGLAVQDTKLATALADASAEMDSHLGRRYALPLSQVPPVLQRTACDIAIYRLMSLLPKETVADARRRYEDAVAWLADLADGRIQLADLQGQELTGGPSVRIASCSAQRVFGDDTLGGFR